MYESSEKQSTQTSSKYKFDLQKSLGENLA